MNNQQEAQKNVLTYYQPYRDYREWVLMKRDVEFPEWLKQAYYVAKRFSVTFEQHDLTIPDDVEVSCEADARVRVKDGTPQIETRITLTFRDEATALLFKLSHDGGAA